MNNYTQFMKILIKVNELTKLYEGDFEPEKLATFINQEFGFESEEYSIFESPPIEVKGGKIYQSISDIKADPITKIIELKIKPGNISDKLPLILKKILCQEVTQAEKYLKNEAVKVFKLASLRPQLLKYPYFIAYNNLKNKLKTQGALVFVQKYKSDFYRSRLDFDTKLITNHVFNLCNLQNSSQIIPYKNFLSDYLEVPDDFEACESYIITKMDWKFSAECPWIDKLLEEEEEKNRPRKIKE